MKKNILITGCSSGLGKALCEYYLEEGFSVYGVSRNKPNIDNANFVHGSFDLAKLDEIKNYFSAFLEGIEDFHIAYLNAGMLGEIKSLQELNLNEIKEVMDLNLYANKEILDILAKKNTKNVIAISSGAAVNGSFGWGSYSLSKASLNMLINLYAKEMKETKLLAVAPGVIETPMTDYIRFDIDDEVYTSAKRLKEGEIQSPKEAAKRLANLEERYNDFESGSFLDVRKV